MRVMDRHYAIQLLIERDIDDYMKLEEVLTHGFIGYKKMDNNTLLEKYNHYFEKPINKII